MTWLADPEPRIMAVDRADLCAFADTQRFGEKTR
jgi:hypothetical protein